MTWTILSLVFAAICLSLSMADEMKLMKNETAVIRNLLREQNERLTRLEMENDALKTTVTKLENDNLQTRDRLVNISDENKALKQEVSDLRRQVTTIQEDSNIENLDMHPVVPLEKLMCTVSAVIKLLYNVHIFL